MTKEPLVSIYIISYNSSKTILEALDSAFNQTYKNIELIVSDDCSTDNTVDLVENWFVKYGNRFTRTLLLTSDTNRGCSANRNRAESNCHGQYIKILDSDDALTPTCIDELVLFMRDHQDAVLVFGNIHFTGDSELSRKCNEASGGNQPFFELTQKEQLIYLLFNRNPIPNTGVLFNRDKLYKYGLTCDERVPMIDDYPRWIKALKQGIELYHYNNIVVNCKVGLGVSTGKPSQSMACFKSGRLFRFYYQYSEWEKEDFEDAVQSIVREECEIYSELLRIRETKAYRIGKIWLSPFAYIKRLFNRSAE